MARKIGQIQQELSQLEEKVEAVAEELHNLYRKYLKSLSKATRSQLIVAAYQICTQTYPASFLSLSLSAKEQLQEKLRQLGAQIEPELFDCLDSKVSELPELTLMEQMLDELSEQDSSDETEATVFSTEIEADFFEQNQLSTQEVQLPTLPTEEEETVAEPTVFKTPQSLMDWHRQVERRINQVIEEISLEANRLLHKEQILPSQLPPKVFEVAVHSQESSSVSAPPNLLNIIVEAENQEKQNKAAIATVTAICLRLTEIEFSDPALNTQRSQIRKIVDKISKLHKQYLSKSRECAVAEAEAAWRASWFDD